MIVYKYTSPRACLASRFEVKGTTIIHIGLCNQSHWWCPLLTLLNEIRRDRESLPITLWDGPKWKTDNRLFGVPTCDNGD